MSASQLPPPKPTASPWRITGARVAITIAGWLALAFLTAPALGLYYEGRAFLYLVPPLVLIYAYCLSHRRRASALLAVAATVVVLLAIGLVMLIPKAASALALHGG